MDNKKSDKYYFGKIINDINLIKEYVGNSTYEEYVSNTCLSINPNPVVLLSFEVILD